MNKIKLLIVPFLLIPVLASCGGSSPEFVIIFESNGGTHINAQKVKKGETAKEPKPAPIKTDYIFCGWFVSPDFAGEEYNFSTPVTEDIVLYAEWCDQTYTIDFQGENCSSTFDPTTRYYTGDSVEFNITVEDGSKYKLPDEINVKGVSNYEYSKADGKVNLTIEKSNVLIIAKAVVKHQLTFTGINCGLYLDKEGKTEYTETDYEAGYTFSGYVIAYEGRSLPTEVTFTSGGKPYESETATYDSESGALSVKMDADINVTAKIVEWYEDNDYLSSLTEEDVTKENPDGSIGEIKTVEVNGQIHKVRLIGVDVDVDENGNTCHTTWEFANLISDENGYSLATYWNNTSSDTDANFDYRDSSIRKALTGEGKGDLNWFRYYGEEEDTEKTGKNLHFASEDNYKVSVLDMLPSSFERALKTVKKTVNVKSDTTLTPTEFNDKLFLLSAKELNWETDYAEKLGTYLYYKNAKNDDKDPIRIKQQVKGTEGARWDGAYVLDGAINYSKYSYAGFNSKTAGYGAHMWLRSPHTYFRNVAWAVGKDGSVVNYDSIGYSIVCSDAYAVAPAFCL